LREQRRLQREKGDYEKKAQEIAQNSRRFRVLENLNLEEGKKSRELKYKKKKVHTLRQASLHQEERFKVIREKMEAHQKQVESYDAGWSEAVAEKIALRKERQREEEAEKKLKAGYAQITNRMIAAPIVQKKMASILPAYMQGDTYRGHLNGCYEALTPVTSFLDRELLQGDATGAKRILVPTYTTVSQLRNEWRNAKHQLHSHLLRGKEIASKLQRQFMQLPPGEWVREELQSDGISEADSNHIATKLKVYGDLQMLARHWTKLQSHLKSINIPSKILERLDSSWVFHMDDDPDRRPWGGKEEEMKHNLLGMVSGFGVAKKWGRRAKAKVAARKEAESREIHRKTELAMRTAN